MKKRLVWILLLVLGPILVVFALIGFFNTFRGTPIQRLHIGGMGEARLEVADPAFRSAVELLTGAPLSEGNQVEILLNGELLRRLWVDLRAARTSVTIRNYYALPGQVADSLAAILVGKAREGVPVLFLYDSFGSEFGEDYLKSLERAGVEVRAFRPISWYSLSRAQHRSHVRAIVIDTRIGYTGGFGFADKWIGDGLNPDSWRETSVRFVGPAVMQLQAAFSIGWAEATGTLLAGPEFFPASGSAPAGNHTAGLLHTAPTHGSTDAERFLALSIAGARHTLYITNSYFVPDDDQRRLLSNAVRRGVDVRILTAGRHSDIQSAHLAGRASYEPLLEAGVRIYEYEPSMIHAKTLVADGLWATVGTMNFDNRSTALNEESNLVLLDRTLGAALDSIYMRDLARSREIHLEQFSRRPWHQRISERMAALMSRVL